MARRSRLLPAMEGGVAAAHAAGPALAAAGPLDPSNNAGLQLAVDVFNWADYAEGAAASILQLLPALPLAAAVCPVSADAPGTSAAAACQQDAPALCLLDLLPELLAARAPLQQNRSTDPPRRASLARLCLVVAGINALDADWDISLFAGVRPTA